ncbi:MAG: sensor histidine kinase [Marinilabiliaceae bacterium]|nr:sensor histidine kinase [Marinilabiliaceae bacterium]
MKDLSMHIMDIVQNSTRANATLIKIIVNENPGLNMLQIKIIDNGDGMDPEITKQVSNPFFTSRTTRKVGLGIPLLIQNAEQTGGNVSIESDKGKGTIITASFQHRHIDRVPWGDIPGTITLLFSGNPSIDFVYSHHFNNEVFEIDSRIIKKELDGIPINQPAIIKFIKEMIDENLKNIGVDINN